MYLNLMTGVINAKGKLPGNRQLDTEKKKINRLIKYSYFYFLL